MTVVLVAAADAPLGAGTITLVNPDGGSATFAITVNAPPTITSVSPNMFGPGITGLPRSEEHTSELQSH